MRKGEISKGSGSEGAAQLLLLLLLLRRQLFFEAPRSAMHEDCWGFWRGSVYAPKFPDLLTTSTHTRTEGMSVGGGFSRCSHASPNWPAPCSAPAFRERAHALCAPLSSRQHRDRPRTRDALRPGRPLRGKKQTSSSSSCSCCRSLWFNFTQPALRHYRKEIVFCIALYHGWTVVPHGLLDQPGLEPDPPA